MRRDRVYVLGRPVRTHQGYRNPGKRPIDTALGFVKLSVKKPG